MTDCIFCKIMAGEIPCTKVYEDDNIFAFLDISPVYKGHTLVIPKIHCASINDIEEEVLHKWMSGVQKVAKAVQSGTGVKGVNLIMNNGSTAGQIVFHAHMHIIPRAEGTAFPALPHSKYEEGEDKAYAEKISSNCQ